MAKRVSTTEIEPDDIPSPANNLPAPVPRHGRLMPDRAASLPNCPTNLDLTTDQGKALLFNSLNPGDVDFDEHGVAHITATHYVVYPDQGTDPETGEVHEFNRTVLIDRDGHTYRTTSAHAPHRIAAALDLFGADAWQRGIEFVIQERVSRKTRRTYHDVRIVVE